MFSLGNCTQSVTFPEDSSVLQKHYGTVMVPSHSGLPIRFGGEHRVSELKRTDLDVLIGSCESLAV